jgi:hypothetical protein
MSLTKSLPSRAVDQRSPIRVFGIAAPVSPAALQRVRTIALDLRMSGERLFSHILACDVVPLDAFQGFTIFRMRTSESAAA